MREHEFVRCGVPGIVSCCRWVLLLALHLLAPSLQAQVQQLPVIGHIGGEIGTASVGNGYAAVQEGRLVRILDISDPSNPTIISTLLNFGYVFIHGTYLYAWSGSILRVFDISDPITPTQVASLTANPPGG